MGTSKSATRHYIPLTAEVTPAAPMTRQFGPLTVEWDGRHARALDDRGEELWRLAAEHGDLLEVWWGSTRSPLEARGKVKPRQAHLVRRK